MSSNKDVNTDDKYANDIVQYASDGNHDHSEDQETDADQEMAAQINNNLDRIRQLSNNKFVQQFNSNHAEENEDDQENGDENQGNEDEQGNEDHQENGDENQENEDDQGNEEDQQDNEDQNNEENEEDQQNDEDNDEEQQENEDEDDHSDNEETHDSPEQTQINNRKKRGLPKTMMANQQKYMEALEKQQKMMNALKLKKKSQPVTNKKGKKNGQVVVNNSNKSAQQNQDSSLSGTRRVIVGGKVKYLPIKTESVPTNPSNLNVPASNKSTLNQVKPSAQSLVNKTKETKVIAKKPIISKPVTKTPVNLSRVNKVEVEDYVDVDDDYVDDDHVDENEDQIPMFKKEQINKSVVNKSVFNKSNVNKNMSSLQSNKLKQTAPSKMSQVSSKTNRVVVPQQRIKQVQENTDEIVEPVKKIPSAIAQKMEIHKAKLAKDMAMVAKKNKMTPGKKLPSKYAKQIESEVKKQTVKNVKNFSDLRRIKALQDIVPDNEIDSNKASINELRKLRIEQRKREQADQKKKAMSNKRESAVQEILKNEKMSKFAKAVAIKNLSVNSRNRRNVVDKKIEIED